MNMNLKDKFNELNSEQKEFVAEMGDAMEKGYQDPVFFNKYFLGMEMHEGQADYLRRSDVVYNPETTRKFALVPCNRWGKTVAIATKHIRYNFYKIGQPRDMSLSALRDVRYFTLDLSPHSNQVIACYNFIFDILHNRFVTKDETGRKTTNKCIISSFFKGKNDAKNRIDFSNGSSFFGASTGEDQGASLAGRQFGYISYDECVFSHHLRVELPGRIMSRTVDMNAPIDLVSTFDTEAKSQQYFFGLVKKALKGQNDWGVKTGMYQDNHFIPEDTKEKAKIKIMNEDYNKYRQVFLGEAVPSSIKVFEPEIVDNIFKDHLKPEVALVDAEYLISVDWGGSDQGDPTVMLVLKIRRDGKYQVVHHEEMKGGSPTVQFALLKTLQEEYNKAKIIMDTNALGGVLIKKILSEMKVKTYDFKAHGGEKGEAITALKLALSYNRRYALEDGKIKELHPEFGKVESYYIPELEDQLGDYEVKDEKLVQDYVVCMYQAMWFLEKKPKRRKKTFLLTRNIR